MAYEHKDNSGSIFPNEKREKDTHPHMTGSCVINGKQYWVSAWTKIGGPGKFLTLAFKPKDQKPEPKKEAPESDGMDFEELPF